MAFIDLQDVVVEFPIYSAGSRSFKTNVLRRVGGRIGESGEHMVVVRALDGITLRLRGGDRLGLIGHNGAGKSTLLRVLSGAYEPSAGSYQISGKASSLLDLTMGMDFELSGRENIVLRGVFLGMTFERARALVPVIEEFSELGDFLERPMRTYSSGMALRLAFAVSTAVQPEIILLDEMIGVGDVGFAAKSVKRLETIFEQSSILVLASHDIATLKKYCNKAIVLRNGRIEAEGSIDEMAKV
jgi:ABC-type polysaccharide/polyol phosphate transport system ATPase subunit